MSRWLHRCEEEGVAGLWPDKSTGRPPKADTDFQAALIEAVEHNTRDLSYGFTRWTSALLAEHFYRVPVFVALDAITGEVTAMVTAKKRSGEFIVFLDWLVNDIGAGNKRVYLFLDNCSIHHTKAVAKFIDDHRERVTIIWNAIYAPNLNLIEHFWGHIQRTAIHNYYFQTVENLEDAIIQAVNTINRNTKHPIRTHLQTEQTLREAA